MNRTLVQYLLVEKMALNKHSHLEQYSYGHWCETQGLPSPPHPDPNFGWGYLTSHRVEAV